MITDKNFRLLMCFLDSSDDPTVCEREHPNTSNVTTFDGFWPSGVTHFEHAIVPENFLEVASWADGRYRCVWANDEQRSLLTYCEGDITIDYAHDEDAWSELIQDCKRFYERNHTL